MSKGLLKKRIVEVIDKGDWYRLTHNYDKVVDRISPIVDEAKREIWDGYFESHIEGDNIQDKLVKWLGEPKNDPRWMPQEKCGASEESQNEYRGK